MPFGRNYHINSNGQIDDTGFMSELKVKKGSKIMVIKNIDTLDCLTNGAMGILVDIVSRNNEIYCLLIKFVDERTGKLRRLQFAEMLKGREHLTPIMMVEHSYHLPSKSKSKKHSAQCTLQQFPIRLAFAVTAHKIQGHTFSKGNTVVLNLNKKRLPDGMIYVMLSRNCNLEDVLINRKIQTSDIQCSQIAKNANNVLSQKHLHRISSGNSEKFVLSFGFLNIRSLKKHHNDIFDFSNLYNFDFFAICETWLLSNENIEEFKLPGYILYSNPAGRGKGLAIYYRKGRIIKSFSSKDFQITAIQNKDVIVTFLYISSKCYLIDVLNHIEIINNENLCALKIFVGDFNFNASSDNLLTNWMKNNFYNQFVKFPTHILGNVIDHVYANNILQYNLQVTNSPVYFSDHVLLNIKLQDKIN